VSTYSPKPGEVTRNWLVIDAQDVVLGRLATTVAGLLRGKHKPTNASHIDVGDFVVVVNADKVALTGKKLTNTLHYHHSGQPGGMKAASFGELLAKDPRRVIEKAVWGMMPKNKLSRQQLTKLKVYSGPEHPHTAQKPIPYKIEQVAQ
jgi:large subunit ribosomal protein L13